MRGGSKRGGTRRMLAGALAILGAVSGTLVATTGSAAAAGGSACTITPALRDVTINQGLGSYANLTRGKDTLVRAYLSLPQTMPACAGSGAYVQITGGSLTVTGGTATTVSPTPAPVSPYAQVAPYGAAPAVDSPADLKFVVPGTAYDNAAATGTYPTSYSFTINYQSNGTKSGTLTGILSAPFTTKNGTTPITATVARPSNNLRVLVVPIGNKSDTSGLQFPSGALTSVQNGMSAVSRVMPVRRGIGDLVTPGNGLRYQLLPNASMIDAGPAGLNLMPGGKFCIDPISSWPAMSSALATTLHDWNAANPNSPADRAMGAVWQDVSNGAANNCYEGISDVNGNQAMARVYSDAQSTSDSGAIIAHELLHTFGGTHSVNNTADSDSPNRAYNVTNRQFLAVNRSEMGTTFDTSYTNNSTLFESAAYALAQCALTPGSTGCSTPGAVGVAGAGGPALVVTGSTCGTSAACTNAISYFDGDYQPRTQADTTSTYTLAQYNGANTTPVAPPVPVNVPCTQPDDSVGSGPSTTNPVCNISLGVTWEAGATRFELKNGSTVLYGASNDGIAPSFVAALRSLGAANLTDYTNVAGDDVQPALCSNGSLVAWVDSTGIRVGRVADRNAVSPAGALPATAEPSWNADCSRLAFSTTGSGNSNGQIQTIGVSNSGAAPSFTGSPVTIYMPALLGLIGSAPASHPAFSVDGNSIFTSINSDIYRIDPGSFLTPNQITCTIPLLNLLSAGCVAIVTTGAVEKNPTVSATGEVAYDSDGHVAIANSDGSNQRTLITNGSLANFGGPVVTVHMPSGDQNRQLALFTRGGSVWAHDVDGSDTQITNGTDTWPALDGSGTTLAIDRTTGGQHDVWIGSLTRNGMSVTVSDNNIQNVTVALFVNCNGTRIPLQDPVPRTSIDTNAGTATFASNVDPNTVCAGGTLEVRAADGWLTSTSLDGTAGSQHDPVPNMYSLPEGAHVNQFSSWAFSGGATDSDESSTNLVLTWSITGPGGYSNNTLTGPNPPDVQPPTNGFTPGTYTVTLTVQDSTGRTASTTHHFIVDGDADHDGILDVNDHSCSGTDLSHDPSNGFIDSDGDGVPDYLDPVPCSAPNSTITITPSTINTANDSGNPINVSITSNAVNLTTIIPSTVRITIIGGVQVSPAIIAVPYSWTATATMASAKFDRPSVDKFLRDNNLLGSNITFTVSGTDGNGNYFLGTGTTNTCSGNKCPMT